MAERIISRRDFLKLLGYGAAALTLAPLMKYQNFFNMKASTPQMASVPQTAFAQTAGSWALGQNTTAVAIHAAIMPSGRIFYLAGSGYHRDRPNGPFDARILDPITGSERNLPLSEDLFCIGITHLANGNVLMAGGTLMYDDFVDNKDGDWYGLSSTYEVDAQSENLIWTANMAHGRWYPTLVTLPDGKAVVVNGLDEYGSANLLVEIYDPFSKTWSKKFNPNSDNTYCAGRNVNLTLQKKPGAGSSCYGGTNNGTAPNVGTYPRMHLMPSGLVVTCGGQVKVLSWNPSNGRWSTLTQSSVYRHYGASFLLPLHNSPNEKGKILLVGGSLLQIEDVEQYATTLVEILDFDQSATTIPVVRQVSPISYRRKMAAPVILPDGKCIIFGGSERGNTMPIRIPEAFDPVTETWQTLPSASVNRVYHQVSLLLPDGRVWTAGSTVASGTEELRTEIFSPSYLFQGPRPTILAMPNVGGYGGTINIVTPDAPNVSSVSLVRLMSCTHHYEANQRLIWLQIVNRGLADITVSAPINPNVAPPGFYMIHVLNGNGVPSVAKIIQIPGTGTGIGGDTNPPSKVLGLSITPIGTQLDLSWTANPEPDLNHYNIYRGTVTGFTVNTISDTPVAQPVAHNYSDAGLSESTTYYYRIAAVDNTGNIGSLSDEASGITTDATAPAKVIGLAATTISSSRIDLSWTANTEPDLAHYNIFRGTTVGFPVNPATDTPLAQSVANSFSDNTGLLESTTYYYKVAAVDTSGNIGVVSDEAIATTSDSTAPSKVLDLTVAAVSGSQLDLTWTVNTDSDLAHYNVYRGIASGFAVNTATDTPLGQPSSNSYSDSNGLSQATSYYYRVAAVDNSGNIGVLSDESFGTTAGDTFAPAKVLGLTATTISSSRIDLAWTPNTEPDIARYNVYRGTSAGFAVNTGTDTPLAQPSTNTYSDTAGLAESTTYYYKVAAVDATGNISILSDEVSATAGGIFYDVPIPGNKPNGAGLGSGNAIRFGVEALNASSAIVGKRLRSWKVRLKKSGTPSGLITARIRKFSGDSIAATFNESIDSPALGTTYSEYVFTLTNPYTIQSGDRIMVEYGGPANTVLMDIWMVDKFDGNNTRRIRLTSTYAGGSSEDVCGTMSSLPFGTGIDTTPPSKVVGLNVTPISKSQLHLTWDSNADPDMNHYNVYRGTTSGFQVNTLTEIPLAQPISTSYADSNGLSESTIYYYRVAAVDNSGNIGTLSDEKSASTLDSTAPSKVLDLSVSPISSNQLDLVWTANTESDLSKYKVYRSTTSDFTINFISDIPIAQPTVNSYSDTDNLSAATTYYYRVVAVDTSGNIGEASDEGSSMTLANSGDTLPPSKVLGLNVTPISSTRIDLDWTPNTETDLDHYNIYRNTTAGFSVTILTVPFAQTSTNTYSDTGLPQSATYYYKVAPVDTAGNIGNVSDEKSGTTFTQIFYNVPIPGNSTGGGVLNPTLSIRYGIEAYSSNSMLIGKSLKSWKVRLKKSGTPAGLVTAKVRRRSDDSVVATFNEIIDSTTLGSAFSEYTFTLSTPYTIQLGDKILIEYGGPPSIAIDIWTVDKFDGPNTRRIRFLTSYVQNVAEEVAGTMSTD